MKNLVSIFAGHDANISFYNAKTNKYYTIEIERLVQKRYFRLHVDNDAQYQKEILEPVSYTHLTLPTMYTV